jgi:GntR family transcriptional regulator/MocR family aminotransferase
MNKQNKYMYQVIYTEIKEHILSNYYSRSDKLDSIRSLAKKKNVSVTTIEKAYDQLLHEGYIYTRPKSGYYVHDISLKGSMSPQTIPNITISTNKNNTLSKELFDLKTYKSTINTIINYYGDELYSPPQENGELLLRQEIQKYVLQERGVQCNPDQIVIGPGTQSLLNILVSLQDYNTLTYLSPGFAKALHIFSSHGYQLFPQKEIKDILSRKSDYLYISPSNIYPTGEYLKVKERSQLINWAHTYDSYIIEDDYNYFIRYNTPQIPSIQSLSKDRVIYLGSFSKSILPSIRISFMILPVSLYKLYKDHYKKFSQGVSKLDQLTLALFLKDGLFSRHTKKLLQGYTLKNELVQKALNPYVQKNIISITGTTSNLHIILHFKNKQDTKWFIQQCNKHQYKFDYYNDDSIIFPYSGIENKDIEQVFQDLLPNH